MTNNENSWLLSGGILISFLVAAMLNVYPLSAGMAMIRPMILMMVLVFWLTFQPQKVGLFTAFIIGLLADLLFDTRLGQHAFSAVLMALGIRFILLYIKQLNSSSAWLIGGASLIFFQISVWLLQFISQDIFITDYSISLLMSIICYPIVLWFFGKLLYKE